MAVQTYRPASSRCHCVRAVTTTAATRYAAATARHTDWSCAGGTSSKVSQTKVTRTARNRCCTVTPRVAWSTRMPRISGFVASSSRDRGVVEDDMAD